MKKEIKILEKDSKKLVKSIVKEEEKVLFKIYKFKVRKKLIFSIGLGLLVMMIGISKIESLLELGKHTSRLSVILALLICFSFLFFTVIRKNISFFSKQISVLFACIFLITLLITLNYNFNILDLSFVSIITTTVVVSLYDLF